MSSPRFLQKKTITYRPYSRCHAESGIFRETTTRGLEDTVTASYRVLRRSKNYLYLVWLLQTYIKQNYHVLQVFREAGLVRTTGI